MYKWKDTENGKVFDHIRADIQKSIKIDQETFDIISGCSGRSFSDKVRNMAAEYVRIKESNTNS